MTKLTSEDPSVALLIEKLSNAVIGSLTKSYLQKEKTRTLEEAIAALKPKTKNNPRSRNQLTCKQAVTGEELILLDLKRLSDKADAPKSRKPQATKSKAPKAPKAAKTTKAISKTTSKTSTKATSILTSKSFKTVP